MPAMEPRIQYAQTADGVSIAFWTVGEGPPLGDERPAVKEDGGNGRGQVHPGGERLGVDRASQDENRDGREERKGCGRGGLPLEAPQGLEHPPPLLFGEASDLLFDELSRPDEEEDDHRLGKKGEEDRRDSVRDVSGDERLGGRGRRDQVGRDGESLNRSREKSHQSQGSCDEKGERHFRQHSNGRRIDP